MDVEDDDISNIKTSARVHQSNMDVIKSEIHRIGAITQQATKICIILKNLKDNVPFKPIFLDECEFRKHFNSTSPILIKYESTFHPKERTINRNNDKILNSKKLQLRICDFEKSTRRIYCKQTDTYKRCEEWLYNRFLNTYQINEGLLNNPHLDDENTIPIHECENIITNICYELHHSKDCKSFVVDQLLDSTGTSRRLVDFRLMYFDISHWYPSYEGNNSDVNNFTKTQYDDTFLIIIDLLSKNDKFSEKLKQMTTNDRSNTALLCLNTMISLGIK